MNYWGRDRGSCAWLPPDGIVESGLTSTCEPMNPGGTATFGVVLKEDDDSIILEEDVSHLVCVPSRATE